MKNKVIVVILVVLAVIAAAFAIFYFTRTSGGEGSIKENQQALPESNGQANGSTQKIVTDEFSIDLPAGWQKIDAITGVSAMAVDAAEDITDPAAKEINFRTYLAIVYDELQGKSLSEYMQASKTELQGIVSSVVFRNEQDITINGRVAKALEAEFTQQGVNFKILMVLVSGEGDDVWTISLNTVESSWDSYKELFSDIVNSFIVKKQP